MAKIRVGKIAKTGVAAVGEKATAKIDASPELKAITKKKIKSAVAVTQKHLLSEVHSTSHLYARYLWMAPYHSSSSGISARCQRKLQQQYVHQNRVLSLPLIIAFRRCKTCHKYRG